MSSSVLRSARALPRSANIVAKRFASTHPISKPTLANLEQRWEQMHPQEQAELWQLIRDRSKADWNELSLQEKKAGT